MCVRAFRFVNEYEDVVGLINKSKSLDLQWRTLLEDLTKAARAAGMQLDMESVLIQPVQVCTARTHARTHTHTHAPSGANVQMNAAI